jgi:excisionase family DNA binding protein
MKILYKPFEIAEMLNVSVSYVYKQAEKGAIKSVKIGSALRFTEKQVADYIEKCKNNKPYENNR